MKGLNWYLAYRTELCQGSTDQSHPHHTEHLKQMIDFFLNFNRRYKRFDGFFFWNTLLNVPENLGFLENMQNHSCIVHKWCNYRPLYPGGLNYKSGKSLICRQLRRIVPLELEDFCSQSWHLHVSLILSLQCSKFHHSLIFKNIILKLKC